MNDEVRSLIDRLCENHTLALAEYARLLEGITPDTAQLLAARADAARRKIYGNRVYIRGLIEISNICKNDCLYCGIRRSNASCDRYRLSKAEILSACEEGYALGFRTFVLQGGEDGYFTDDVLQDIVRAIKQNHPDCAVTLSLGERSRESYAALRGAGADRYLLRHETANPAHYARLHPREMSFDHRMRCLRDLKELGYQVGCGFMVGSPYQRVQDLAMDLKFIEEFRPEMVGIGPFIPHAATCFARERAGSVEMTCALLSIIRLIHPAALLPATTALGTLDPHGREKGIRAGANVVMPNLSPHAVRNKYALYDNKLSDGDESAQSVESLKQRMISIGYEVVTDRGDYQE
ncbi:MAG: [FeFe] hydrogenase H-cluster radical SAM maturase HydE [Clostridiales bacterium]|nr:[FeFe] hydrogenase H-cluster radical SAM maturase HydE [Clostridiales bacterium]